MFSKLCQHSYCRFQQLYNRKNIFTLQNVHRYEPVFNSTRSIHTDDESKYVNSDEFVGEKFTYDIPSVPEPPVDLNVLLNSIGEPTFASLGLNNYTPTGFVQYLLENVHVHLDLPWWACIIITAVLIRSAMLPVFLEQRRTIIDMQNNMSVMTKMMFEAIKARESGNGILMIQKIKEFENFNINNKMRIFPLIKPIFIQAPVFISVFLALKGMANVPVASLATGGLFWFTDLTICDPYYILPLITAGSLALMLELGAEVPISEGQNFKWALRLIAPVTLVFISQFPATLLLYWTTSNMYSLIFSQLIRIPAVKSFLKLPEMQKHSSVDNPNQYGIKHAMEIINSMQEISMREKANELRWAKDHQSEILNRGLKAAEVRKKMKESMTASKDSSINVTGTIVDNDEKQNKL